MSFVVYFIRGTVAAVTDAWPTVTVEIEFSGTTWTDVSALARTASVRRGRTNELARVEAGTMTLTLDNTNREFDPLHTGSPYYPNVLPLRRVRVKATYGGLIYPLFTGYIERWPRERPSATSSLVSVQAIDALAVLAGMTVSGTFPAELSGARVNRILDMVGWPAADRLVETGLSVIAETIVEPPGVAALAHLQEVAVSEAGLLFASADGKITFHDRHHRIRDEGTSVGTFGDYGDGSEIPYTLVAPSFDLDEVYNHATVTTPGGTVGEANDEASQVPPPNGVFKRSLPVSTLLESGVEAADQAAYLVGRFKDPAERYDSLVLEPGGLPAVWPHALGRELGDRVTVTERPPGGGSANTSEQYVESTAHEIAYRRWQTTWAVSPAETQAVWVLEHPTLGSIDGPGRLAY